MAEVRVHTERVDDVPLLVYQQCRMGIPQVLDEVIYLHGNRQGLSVGWLTTFWLAYILSEADHRMSVVEEWASGLQETCSVLAPGPVRVKDFTDDRLADVLRYLSEDVTWEAVEQQLGPRLIRIYNLEDRVIRLDSTTVVVYHDPEGHILFRHGHSKDHRPDLPQFKVMLGTLDPLGMPLATLVVSGNEADDGLYIPTVRRAQPVVGQGGRLYVGDAKMSALETRAFLHTHGDYYLTPWAQVGKVPDLLRALLEPVWKGEQPLERVDVPGDSQGGEGKPKVLALGYETTRRQEAQVEGRSVAWEERVGVVYSPSLARRARRGLAQRLEQAEQKIRALTPPRGRGRKQWEDGEDLQAAVRKILKQHGVEGLLEVAYIREVEQREVRAYRDRPARTEERVRYVGQVNWNRQAIATARRLLGWRLYVTNAPVSRLSLATAVEVYRDAPRIERDFSRLKGHPLGLRPLYVQREDHAKGMVRLLSLALRVLTVTEDVVREGLRVAGEALRGLYPGNPKRQTARPTTEGLLRAFHGITLTVVKLPDQTIRHITPLSSLQHRILGLLSLPASIYEDLALPIASIPP